MLLRVASFACLGGFLYGYDLGLISGALSPIKEELHTSQVATEVMVGAAKFGAIFGTFLGGALMLYYGRRLTIGLDSLFFILGPVIMAFSAGIVGLTTGRFLVGLGIGVSAVVVPAYLGEVAPAKVRGRIVEVYEVMLCLGMLSAMLVDAALQRVPWNWRWMVGAPVLPALFLALALVVLPESPRWLVVNARLDEALAVIHRLFTDKQLPAGTQQSTAEVEQELMELWSSVEKDKAAAKERCLQAQQRSVQSRAHTAWRPLKLRPSKWHSLQESRPNSPGAEGLPMHALAPTLCAELSNNQHSSFSAMHEVDAGLLEQPGEGNARRGSMGSSIDAAPEQQHVTASEDVEERQASGSQASTSAGPSLPHLRVAVQLETPQGSDQPVHEALKDPTSPLYRSLSRIPSGLPPVRTKSDLESMDTSPHSAQHAPRKSSLELRRAKGSQLPDSRTRPGDGDSFWRVFWVMMLDIKAVATGPETQAFQIALWLAFFNQAMASSAIINYAPQLLAEAGIRSDTQATLLTCAVTGAKIMGVFLGVVFIDSLGRRKLLIGGSAVCAAAMVLLFGGVFMQSVTFEVLAMCIFMLAFNCSYAGVFWVLLSELFSMSTKSPAASAATAMLFAAGFLADSLFLTLLGWFGAYSFLLFGAIAALGGVYSYTRVPETKGRTLAEVQAMITGSRMASGQAGEVPEYPPESPATLETVRPPRPDPQLSPSQTGALLSAEEGGAEALHRHTCGEDYSLAGSSAQKN